MLLLDDFVTISLIKWAGFDDIKPILTLLYARSRAV